MRQAAGGLPSVVLSGDWRTCHREVDPPSDSSDENAAGHDDSDSVRRDRHDVGRSVAAAADEAPQPGQPSGGMCFLIAVLCLLLTDSVGPSLSPQGVSFLSVRQTPQDRDKNDSGGLGASGNVALAVRRPHGLLFTPAGVSFLSVKQVPQDGSKSDSGELGTSRKLARTQARIRDWPPGRRLEGGRGKDVESTRSVR